MKLDFKEATSPIQNTIDFHINTIDFNMRNNTIDFNMVIDDGAHRTHEDSRTSGDIYRHLSQSI